MAVYYLYTFILLSDNARTYFDCMLPYICQFLDLYIFDSLKISSFLCGQVVRWNKKYEHEYGSGYCWVGFLMSFCPYYIDKDAFGKNIEKYEKCLNFMPLNYGGRFPPHWFPSIKQRAGASN